MNFKLSVLVLLMAGIVSCSKYKETTLEDGTRIQFHEKGKSGKLPKDGDIINFDLEIKTAGDSVINSSYKNGAPFNVPIQKGYFKGSFENGLYNVAEGDSATIFVSADTLFNKMGQPLPPEIKAGTDIRFIVKMHKVSTAEELQKETAAKRGEETKIIQDFVAKNMKGALKTTSGEVFYVVTKEGSGDLIKDGDAVSVNYAGKFMDGKEFDKNDGLNFTVGEGRVIPGWEIALKTMKKGGKSTFIIPSDQAYGEMGAGPIPPHSPLVFDIEVVEINKK